MWRDEIPGEMKNAKPHRSQQEVEKRDCSVLDGSDTTMEK